MQPQAIPHSAALSADPLLSPAYTASYTAPVARNHLVECPSTPLANTTRTGGRLT
jgi:hypothetical protein